MKITHHRIGRHAIEVWVPPTLSPETPLLVMHDGKNVFNPKTSTVGVTWGVVEAVEREIAPTRPDLQPLIVAVWVPDESRRFQELGLGPSRYGEERWLEILADEPLLLVQPLVRYQQQVTVGLAEKTWKEWMGR